MTRSNRRLSTPTWSRSTSGPIDHFGGRLLPPRGCAAGLDGPLHQFADVDLLEEDIGRAGVGPGHLQQVGDHALEPAQVVAQQLEGPLGPRGQVVTVRLEHLQRRRQRGQRRAQLMADVGIETGLALDAGLELVDHGVEASWSGPRGRDRPPRPPGGCRGGPPRWRPRPGRRRTTGAAIVGWRTARGRGPSIVVTTPVTTRVSPRTRRVWPRSASENTSKYVAWTEGMGTPRRSVAGGHGLRDVRLGGRASVEDVDSQLGGEDDSLMRAERTGNRSRT